jgi:hypothetical protein
VYPPHRVLHGQVSATACAQAAVRITFQDLADKLLCWLDDLLMHCRDVDGLLRGLKIFLDIWTGCGVKLGAARVDLCSQEVQWCGRAVSKDGVWLEPRSVYALTAMQPPVTGADSATVCVRSAVPSYAQEMSTLGELLDEVYKRAGGRTRKRTAKVRFSVFWNEAHGQAIARSKSLLASEVTVAHVSPKHIACLLTGIGHLAPGWKSFMGDRCCPLSASTSFLPVDAWE